MIEDINIERALEYIRTHAQPLARAKAERIYLEQYRKSKKAILIQEVKGTVQEREAYAYAHKEYIDLLDGLRAAVEQEEELRWMMTAAQAKVEVWRSQQANNRFIDKAHQ